MNRQLFLQKFLPFLGLGCVLVFLIVGLIFISYLFILGALLGTVLFIVAWLRSTFFPKQYPMNQISPHFLTGRVFDQKDEP